MFLGTDYDKYSIQSIDMGTGFNKSTSECLFMLDQIKDATLENGMETTYSTGRLGVRLSALDKNKTAKVSGTNGYIVGGLLAQQIGSAPEVARDVASIVTPACDIIEIKEPDAVKTTFTATGIPGNEVRFIYRAQKDMTQGEKFAQAAEASESEFSYDPATKEITLPTGVFKAGEKVIVFYDYLAKGKKFTNSGDNFPKTCKMVFDLTIQDVCDNGTLYYAKLVMPNAKIDGNFSWTIGNDPAVGSFTFESLLDICSATKELWYLIIPSGE